MANPSRGLIEAIAVTAELTATEFTGAAARVMAGELARYPEAQVLAALTRVRREVRGRFTLADVLQRLEDGRPGPEEAWAMLPRDERSTVVWSDEMREAFAVAGSLIAEDPIAARMAFKEAYSAAVQRARDAERPVHWEPSLGHDPAGREGPLLEAVERGRLAAEHVLRLLPYDGAGVPPRVLAALAAKQLLKAPA